MQINVTRFYNEAAPMDYSASVDDVWTNYQELAEAGQVPSNLWRDDRGQVFFSLDH